MKKRIAVGVGLLVLVCTGATLLDPYCRLLGLVRRESFYQGKPTIYWERQIAGADERARTGNGNSNFIFDWIEKRTGYSIGNSQPDLDVLRIDSAAIPVLRELLKSSVAYVRWNAAIVLCAHDEEADDAVGEVLGEVLTCHNKYVLRGHMFSFNFGNNAFIIAPSYPPDTSWKEFTLSRSGEVASAPLTWNDVVSESSSNCASGVLRMVNELGPRGTPVLIRAIGQEDCKVREGVATLLGERRSEAATVIPVLRSALSDPSVRLPVAAALKKLDPGWTGFAPIVIHALRNPSVQLVNDAIGIMEEADPIPRESIPALLDVLRGSGEVRWESAGMILARCGEDAWPALKQALQDPKPEIRRRAVIALNYALPSLETEVTRALLRAQDDSHECVRKPSLECLSELGSNASIDVTNVHRALAGLGDQPREDLGESFCRFDSGAEKIVATLMTLLKDDEPEVRTKAANVIFRFGGVPGVAIVLAEALKNNDSGNLRFALTRLCELGEEAATALPAVKAVLAHKDRSVRELAICAMCALKPNPGSVAAVIAGPADNVDAGNREKAVTVLAKFGPACEFSILELASMILRDNDRFERFSTAYMLKRIDLEPSSSGQSDELRAIEREWRELWMREENQPRHLPHR